MSFVFVSDAARQFGVDPRCLSTLFYCRKLDGQRCPVVGGRRVIPTDYLPEIEAALKAAGKLRETTL